MGLNESDTRAKLIDPAIHVRGCLRRAQATSATPGRRDSGPPPLKGRGLGERAVASASVVGLWYAEGVHLVRRSVG